MANFNNPQLSSTYTDFLTHLKDRDTDLAAMFANDTVSVNNWPARSVRFNTNSNKFQRRNSANSAFEDLTTNHHFPAITIDGSGSLTVGGAISGASINVTGLISGGRINATGSDLTATGLYRPATNTLGITTNTVLRWTIDSVGRLFNNGQATHQGDNDSHLQVYNDAGGRIDLLREDSSVSASNSLGQIRAYTNVTADNSFNPVVIISLNADAATYTNTSHPTRIQFSTTAINSTTARTVACLDQAGFFGIGASVGSNPSHPLHVNGGGTNNVALFKSNDDNMFIGLADGASSSDFHNRIAAIGNEIQIRANGATVPHLALTDTFRVVIRKSSEGATGSGTVQQHHLQVFGTDANASIGVSRGSGNASPPTINLYKYKDTSYQLTAAQVGDAFGDIQWYASDGTEMKQAFRVRVNSLATDFSGNSTAVSTGAVPSSISLRALNNDGGNVTFFAADHNGHIKLTPHQQPSGGGQNAYSLDIRANNTNGAGNLIRFTETDTTVAAGRILGGIQFATLDTGAQNGGLIGQIFVEAESGTPHGIMRFKMAATEHITIEGLNNHLGIHNTDPSFPLDVVGNTLIDGSLCVSNDRAGFITMNDNAALQVTGATNARSMINITRYTDSNTSFPSLVLTKNHNTSATGNTACSDNSVLGAIEFQGTNGDGYSIGSRIKAQTAAAFGTGERSTDLHFMVATSNTLNTYMVLTNYGALHVGDNTSIDVDYTNIGDARLVVIDNSGPDIVLHRRDSETQNTNQIGRLVCSDSDGGTPAPPSAKIEFVASENHEATKKGTDIVLGMCANGSNTITNRFTFRDSGAFGVNGDTVGDSGDVLVSKGDNPPEYAPVGAKAWVSFDGDVSSNNNENGYERAYNVSSVTDNGTGDYTINWNTNFSNNQYAMVVSVSYSNHIADDGHGVVYIISQSNGNARIKVNSEDNGAAVMDKDIVNVVAFH